MNFEALKAFIQAEMPILNSEMKSLLRSDVLRVMNAMTDRAIPGESSMNETSAIFLEDLKRMHVRGTLNLSALPKAIAEIRKIQRGR